MEIRNKANLFRWSTFLLFTNFSKTLLTTERRPMGPKFLAADLSPTFLNTGITNVSLKIWKSRNSLENKTDTFWRFQLVCIKVHSCFFTTTTGIQLRPDDFNKFRFTMTFLAILRVREIFHDFRLVLEGKAGKVITQFWFKIKVLRKVFSKQFCFNRCRRKHLWAVE